MKILGLFSFSLLIYLATVESLNKTEYNEHLFPMEQFLNLSTTTTTTTGENASFMRYRCRRPKNNCSLSPNPCCGCTDDCWRYGTCCIDYIWNLTKIVELEDYLQTFNDKTKQNKQTKCEKVLPFLESSGDSSKNYEIETLYMVSTCLQNARPADIELCLDNTAWLLPVFGLDNYLYKNKYCAMCNNMDELYLQSQLQIQCVSINDGIHNGQYFSLQLLKTQTEECIVSIKKQPMIMQHYVTCHANDLSGDCSDNDRNLCRMHQATTLSGHKNYYCMKCDPGLKNNSPLQVNTTTLQCPLECDKDKICYSPGGRDPSKYIFRFDIDSTFTIKNWRQTFPIWDFLGIPKSHNFLEYEGLEQYLCSSRRPSCCNCNSDCTEKRRCCIDIFWNETAPVDLDVYTKRFLDKTDKTPARYCLKIYPHSKYDSDVFVMTKSCLRTADEVTKKNCLVTNQDQFFVATGIPVLGADGKLYANSFCARCNDVEDYEYINMTLNCRHQVSNPTQLDGKCMFKMADPGPAGAMIQQCQFELYDNNKCRFDDSNFEMCAAYSGDFGGDKNINCQRCNSNKSDVVSSAVQYCASYSPSDEALCSNNLCIDSISFGWSTLISFTDTSGRSSTSGDSFTDCSENQVFDINDMKCVTFSCPIGYRVDGLDCVLIDRNKNEEKSNVNSTLELLMNRYPRVYVELDTVDAIEIKTTQQSLNREFVGDLNFTLLANLFNSTVVQSNVILTIQELDNIIVDLQKKKSYQFFIGMSMDALLLKGVHGFDLSKIFPKNNLCPFPKTLPTSAVTLHNQTSTIIYQNTSYNYLDATVWVEIAKHSNVTKKISFCSDYHLNEDCLWRFIPSNETNLNDNMTLFHNSSSTAESLNIHHFQQYFPVKNGFQICINEASEPETITPSLHIQRLQTVESYITVIGTLLSIICYILVILSCTMFKQLRNIPGLNNCFLCVSLLVSDFIFLMTLVTKKNNVTCITSAVLMHWALLSAFVWTLIIAIDLIKRFGQFSNHLGSGKHSLRIRLAIGFLPAVVIVLVCLIIDRLEYSYIGYGDGALCWIGNVTARLIVYIIPTGIIALVASISLCYTMYNIIKAKKISNSVLGQKGISKFESLKMALKLATVLGVTELIGYIQIPLSPENTDVMNFNIAMGFIYSALRSFRGVFFFFLVYVYNGKLLEYTRKQFRNNADGDLHDRSLASSSTTASMYYQNSPMAFRNETVNTEI